MKHLQFLLIFLLLSPVCFADSVELTSGRVVTGTIIEETDEYVRIQVSQGKGTVRLERSRIVWITDNAEPQLTPEPYPNRVPSIPPEGILEEGKLLVSQTLQVGYRQFIQQLGQANQLGTNPPASQNASLAILAQLFSRIGFFIIPLILGLLFLSWLVQALIVKLSVKILRESVTYWEAFWFNIKLGIFNFLAALGAGIVIAIGIFLSTLFGFFGKMLMIVGTLLLVILPAYIYFQLCKNVLGLGIGKAILLILLSIIFGIITSILLGVGIGMLLPLFFGGMQA